MAKRKKLQDQNPPRRVEIRGQDHLLAYITPEEAALLKARGGSGKPGPMGIPQFGYGDDDGNGYGDGDSDTGGMGSGDSDTGGFGGGGYGEDPGFDGGGGGSAQNDKSGGPSSAGRGGGRASAGMSSSRGFSGGDGNGIDFDSELDVSGLLDSALSGLSNAQINKAVDNAKSILGMSPGRSQAKYGTTAFAGLIDNLTNLKPQTTDFTEEELAAGRKARADIAAHNAAVAAGQRFGEDKTDYTPQFGPDVANAMAQDEKNRLAQQVAQSYIDYAGVLGPELYSAGTVGGSLRNFFKTGSTGAVPIRSNYFDDPTTLSAFKDIALGQISGRMGTAGAAPGLLGAVGNFTLGSMKKALEEGGRPVFDAKGQLKGVFSEGPFGLGEVYTGMPVEGVEGTGYDNDGRDGGSEDIKPADPITGQCDEGYIFDEDLQACRLDTPGVGGATESEDIIDSGVYGRLGLLDVAPVGLSGFYSRYGVQPQDFGAANLAYRRGAGTQFGIFGDPYEKKGYTLLG